MRVLLICHTDESHKNWSFIKNPICSFDLMKVPSIFVFKSFTGVKFVSSCDKMILTQCSLSGSFGAFMSYHPVVDIWGDLCLRSLTSRVNGPHDLSLANNVLLMCVQSFVHGLCRSSDVMFSTAFACLSC